MILQAVYAHQPSSARLHYSSSSCVSRSSCPFPQSRLGRNGTALQQHGLRASRRPATSLSRREKDTSLQEEEAAEEVVDEVFDGEDMDGDIDEEELDTLFEDFGEVVIADTSDVTAEVDDDSQSLALAVALAAVANDTKAADVVVLHVKPLVYWTCFFVIATAFSRPQLAAIGEKMQDVAVERFKIFAKGDTKPNSWMLLDFGDVVVHVFLPNERAFYNLEEFYGNANRIPLPFESEQAISKS